MGGARASPTRTVEGMWMETLIERDGLIAHNWYIACLSQELKPSQVIQRIVYEKPLAIFRTESGKVSVLIDRCLHRLALLSRGEVRGEHLACMYHGWEYNVAGEVERIPSEDPATQGEKNTARRLFLVWSKTERFGFGWDLGSRSRAHLPGAFLMRMIQPGSIIS